MLFSCKLCRLGQQLLCSIFFTDDKFYITETYTQRTEEGGDGDTYCGSTSDEPSLGAVDSDDNDSENGTITLLCQKSVVVMQFISSKLTPIPKDQTPSEEPVGFICE